MQAGVVPGGGVALLRARQHNLDLGLHTGFKGQLLKWDLISYKDRTEHQQRLGAQILLDAIRQPAIQIVRNTGRTDYKAIVEKIERTTGSQGYNAAQGTFCDLYDAGVVDPAKVTLVALTKAASIGALLLTTEVLVTDKPELAFAQLASGLPPIYRP